MSAPERIMAADVARITGLSVEEVRDLARRGKFAGAAQLGKAWTFDRLFVEHRTWGLTFSPMVWRRTFERSRQSAVSRDLSHDLTWSEFQHVACRARGRCELSGIPFTFDGAKRSRHPWAPSLDRIDSDLGYTFSNCRLVSLAVNIALSHWGDEVLIPMAKGIAARVSTQ